MNETAVNETVDSSSRAAMTRIIAVKEAGVKGSERGFAPITSKGSPNAATPVHVVVAVPIGNTHSRIVCARVRELKPANQPA